jgi:hypothetical protein
VFSRPGFSSTHSRAAEHGFRFGSPRRIIVEPDSAREVRPVASAEQRARAAFLVSRRAVKRPFVDRMSMLYLPIFRSSSSLRNLPRPPVGSGPSRLWACLVPLRPAAVVPCRSCAAPGAGLGATACCRPIRFFSPPPHGQPRPAHRLTVPARAGSAFLNVRRRAEGATVGLQRIECRRRFPVARVRHSGTGPPAVTFAP